MSWKRWLTGWVSSLRARLLLAFVLLCLVTAVAVAGALYVRARDVILQKAQDTAVIALTDKIKTLYPVGGLPPSQAVLDDIASKLSGRNDSAFVVYGDRMSRSRSALTEISPELRRAVADGKVAWQRIVYRGVPGLIIGTQMVFSQPDGTPKAALEIYSSRGLVAEQQSIDDLASTAALVGAAALAFAVLLAVLATSSVLRPVRELGQAAHQLGEGDLTTRLTVRGADELAGVARTFNNTAEALENQVGELQRMEADARRFVADVSHELRTPLAAMTVVTDVLDEEAPGLSGDAGRAARLVSQETHNLTRLVNDLIEVTRFDSGAAATALDEVDVAAAVNATLRARGWTDQVEIELAPDIRARLDPRRLDVILANLVGNALRHGAPPVSVRLFAEPDWITFEVGDRGPGLDPRVLPHVFDRFYKADTARTRSEGSGLGLAIAWENARLHRDGDRQGSLVAANRPDGGAVFVLRLPRYATNAADTGGER